jgi:hypothetical protein
MTDNQDNPGINVPPPPALRGPSRLGAGPQRESAPPPYCRAMRHAAWGSGACAGGSTQRWFLKTMRDGDGPIRTDKPVPKLTTTGPFRYTRNPRYLALTPILGNRVQTRSGEEGGEDRFDREPRKLM